MKRPLVDNFEFSPAAMRMMVRVAAPTWQDRLLMKLDSVARRAFRAPVSYVHPRTNNACTLFNDVHEVIDRLNLTRTIPRLETNQKILHPLEAPIIDQSAYFAQWGLIWEPVTDIKDAPPVKSRQTLNIEVGAGYYLLSLTFTPQPGFSFELMMQLDSAAIQRGHEVYSLPLSLDGSLEENRAAVQYAAQVMETARATITMIDEDYPQAEMTLADGLSPIIESLQAAKKNHHPCEAAKNSGVGAMIIFGNMRP